MSLLEMMMFIIKSSWRPVTCMTTRWLCEKVHITTYMRYKLTDTCDAHDVSHVYNRPFQQKKNLQREICLSLDYLLHRSFTIFGKLKLYYQYFYCIFGVLDSYAFSLK